MKINLLALGVIPLSCAMLSAPASAQQADKDIAALQGAWKVTKAESNHPDAAKRYMNYTLTIMGQLARLGDPKNNQQSEFTINLQSEKTPKHLNIVATVGGDGQPVPLLGIYDIQKDRIRIAWCKESDAPRPTAFAIDPDGWSQVTLVLERMKKE